LGEDMTNKEKVLKHFPHAYCYKEKGRRTYDFYDDGSNPVFRSCKSPAKAWRDYARLLEKDRLI